MAFLRQVRLILWKNFTLRKRQKIRCLVELVWPLILFSILMWVRTRGLKSYINECHFEEKAMPSTGALPFFQSFICTLNNTCHKNVQQRRGENLQDLNATLFERLFDDFESLLGRNVKMKEKGSIESATKDIAELASLAQMIAAKEKNIEGRIALVNFMDNPRELRAALRKGNLNLSEAVVDSIFASEIVVQNISLGNLAALRKDPRSLFCDPSTLRHVLQWGPNKADPEQVSRELCALPTSNLTYIVRNLGQNAKTQKIMDELWKFTELNLGRQLSWADWRQLRDLSSRLVESLRKLDSFQNTLTEVGLVGRKYLPSEKLINETKYSSAANFSSLSPSVLTSVAVMQNLLCGPDATSILDQVAAGGGESTRFDELKDQLKDSETQFDEYVNDTEASEECNNFFRTLERNSLTRFMWNQVKPFIRGKILYAPKEPVLDRVMERVNESFAMIERLYEAAQLLANTVIPKVKDSLVNQTVSLQFIQDSWPKILTFMETNLGKDFEEQIKTVKEFAERFLQANNTELRETALNTIEELQVNITILLECFDTNKIQSFATEEEAVEKGMELLELNKLWAVISFSDIPDANGTLDKLPPFVTYKIRTDSGRIDTTKRVEDILRRPGPRRRPGIDLKYITYGFAYLQDMLDSSIIKEQTNRTRTPGIFLQQFPYPCHIIDKFVLAISRTFPLFMTLSWVYTSAMIVKSIVYEKERRLKETMRVMGLGNGVHWIGWFVDSFTPMFITIIFLTMILVYGKVLENSSPSLIFVFLLTYAVATISKCFLISAFFSKANLAAAAGGIIFFVMYLPYAFTVLWEEKMLGIVKTLVCLISNVAFGYGCSYLSFFEETGIGAHWSNYDKSPLLNDAMSLQSCMLMLLVDAVFYGVITWYVEAVFPGEYGVPKPWYFFVMKSYWCGKDVPVDTVPVQTEDELLNRKDASNFEEEPTSLQVGVALKSLSKTYSNGKIALSNLSLNFYQNQITAFLGHNGAGKTTTISILTGLFPPSKGTAVVNGYDIRTDMDSIRGSLGTCPQHNVLFDQLTVKEHLLFYSYIKGKERAEVEIETEKMILDLGLPHKKNEMSKNLSGGMQRKLSIAVAFVGGSKTVILDEPTSGVDPFSRRSIWELLIKYKQNRTVILTTHFMDEADLLADRIAIISGGNLQCCGSSLFLKSRFGSGFYLTVERLSPKKSEETAHIKRNGSINGIDDIRREATGQIKIITETVQDCIQNAELLEAVGQELVYSLPFTMAQRNSALPTLQNLLDVLDKQGQSIGINSYGISDTSLEEIFLKIAHCEEYNGDQAKPNGKKLADHVGNGSANSATSPTDRVRTVFQTGNGSTSKSGKRRSIYVQPNGGKVQYMRANTDETCHIENGVEKTECDYWDTKKGRRQLKLRQFMALQTKRFHHTSRNPKALFCEIILPAVFVCLAFVFTMIMPGLQEEPQLELHPWMYTEPNNMFLEVQSPENIWTQRYRNQLLGDIGLGTRCVGNSSYKCEAPKELFSLPKLDNSQISPKCSCKSGTPKCPAGAGGPPPQRIKIATGDVMYDLTSRNVSDWLVKTEEQFYKIRYGGFSLGVYNPLSRVNVSRVIDRIRRLDMASNMNETRFNDYDNLAATLTNRSLEEDLFDNIKVWFNNKGWPMSVSYLNAITNVVLRASLPPEEDPKQYGIRAINHPMNFTPTQLSQEMIKQSSISLLHAIAVIFAMSFVPASFVVTLIEERASKAKHLQFVSGVDAAVYWVAAFFWDMMSYLVSATLCIFIFLIFDEKAYVSGDNLPGLVLLLIFYGWASIPLMYPASFMSKVPSTAFVFLACWNLFVGIVTTVAVFVLEIFDDEELQFIGSILKEVFLIFPHFCLGQGLMKMATNHLAAQTFATFGVELRRNRFEWNFLGKNLLAMTIEGFLFFALTLAIEFGLFDPFWQWILIKINRAPKPDEALSAAIFEDEDDVGAERQRIKTSGNGEHVLAINDLTKIYKTGGRPAVDKLCFGVHRAECFGLLGLNGAGKTSTFKMLTGDTKATAGDAFVCGLSVQKELHQVRRKLGYCPQFDALDPLLTAREHLEFYSKLRGVPSQQLTYAVDEGLSRLGLLPYADKCAGTYSGGNKRKLSTAIALVGNPPLVFLDEPTSGMDPAARRFLWQCILRAIREGRSVVLTSHSMEECQALCSRLTVMVNGRLSCLGSAQHLKSKFGNCYTLVVRCPQDALPAMEAHMKLQLPEAVLTESHHTRLVFQLPTGSHKLSAALGALEVARTNNLLYDYSLSQTTLEEVFLRFANKQNDIFDVLEEETNTSCFNLNFKKNLKLKP